MQPNKEAADACVRHEKKKKKTYSDGSHRREASLLYVKLKRADCKIEPKDED